MYTQVNESWNKEFSVEGVYTSKKDAEKASVTLLRDHFWNSNSVRLPKDISFKNIVELAQEEELSDSVLKQYKIEGNPIIRWTCELDILSRQIRDAPKTFRKDTSQFIEDVFEVAHGENSISKGFNYISVLKKLKGFKRDASKWKNRSKPVYKRFKSKTGRMMHYCIELVEKKNRISKQVYDAAKQQEASRK